MKAFPSREGFNLEERSVSLLSPEGDKKKEQGKERGQKQIWRFSALRGGQGEAVISFCSPQSRGHLPTSGFP